MFLGGTIVMASVTLSEKDSLSIFQSGGKYMDRDKFSSSNNFRFGKFSM
jgi:hypothetical protein